MAAASASATLWKEKERNKGSILWRKCDFILIKDSRWKWISFGCGGLQKGGEEERRRVAGCNPSGGWRDERRREEALVRQCGPSGGWRRWRDERRREEKRGGAGQAGGDGGMRGGETLILTMVTTTAVVPFITDEWINEWMKG